MDYPRDYIIPNQEIEVGTAFVVMPIRPEFDLPLGVITDVCNTLGIKARRADDIARQDFIMSNILDGIAKSEIVIVDITGNNPNVFYELGIAHSLRTRQAIIIITQDEDVSKSPFLDFGDASPKYVFIPHFCHQSRTPPTGALPNTRFFFTQITIQKVQKCPVYRGFRKLVLCEMLKPPKSGRKTKTSPSRHLI